MRNPPPVQIPVQYKSNPQIARYEREQMEAIRGLFDSITGTATGGGGSGGPSASDEFSRRYTMVMY